MYELQKVRQALRNNTQINKEGVHLIFRIQSLIQVNSERFDFHSILFHMLKKKNTVSQLQAAVTNMSSHPLSPTVEVFRM